MGGIPEEAEEYRDNWLALNGIKIDYGISDEFKAIPVACEYFKIEMSNAGIPVIVESYQGGHGNRVNARLVSHVLPFFEEKLKSEQ